jgi:hypothetical protein
MGSSVRQELFLGTQVQQEATGRVLPVTFQTVSHSYLLPPLYTSHQNQLSNLYFLSGS